MKRLRLLLTLIHNVNTDSKHRIKPYEMIKLRGDQELIDRDIRSKLLTEEAIAKAREKNG